jgi:two-component system cell cycle sensor histidine kinase/response regulator CckA
LLQLVPLALMEIDVDVDGQREITYFSPAATEMYGYEPDEIVGQDPSLLWGGEPDALAQHQGVLGRKGGWSGRSLHRTKDGRTMVVELDVRAWHQDQGELGGYLMSVRDVTLEAEQVRHLAETVALLEVAPDAIFARNAERKITFWNRAAEQTYGFRREEVIGRSPGDVLQTRYPIALEEIERMVAETGAWEGDLTQTTRDGRRFTVASNWGALYDDGGRMTGLVEVNRDVTARLALQAALDEAERDRLGRRLIRAQRLESLGQLAGGIAHDFNNLLAVVAGYTTALTDGVQDLAGSVPADARRQLLDDVGEVARATKQAADLTHQLLAFARQEAVRSEPVSLNDVVADLLELLRRTLGEHVLLKTGLDANLLSIMADPGQIGQVLMNLAVNARDAMPGGGTLTIETLNMHVDDFSARGLGDLDPGWYVEPGDLNPGWYVELVVSDTGLGMPLEVVDHAFDPFFTTKASGEGSGLGLATVYGVVTAIGGTISLYSEPGRGTVLRMLFPALDAADLPTARAETAPPPPRADGEHTILVVEDQAPLQAITARILTRAGYRVLTAASGPEAVGMADATTDRIDVLLTDVIMPEMLGQVVAQRMKRMRPDLKVIFTSGFARPALEQGRGVLDGPLLQKPVPAAELLTQIAAILAEP